MRWILLAPLVGLVACIGERRVERSGGVPLTDSAARAIAAARVAGDTQAVHAVTDTTAAMPTIAEPVAPPALPDPVRFDAGGRPILPYVLPDACEGEDCLPQFDAVACLPAEVRKAPDDSAPPLALLAQNDTVRVTRRDLHVRAAGTVVMRSDLRLDHDFSDEDVRMARTDTVRLARGDTVYLLHYQALGWWTWAYHGRTYQSNEFWGGSPIRDLGGNSRDSTVAVARSMPRREDWWLVEMPSGATGWWNHAGSGALQSVDQMQHWGDDCAQVMQRARQRANTQR